MQIQIESTAFIIFETRPQLVGFDNETADAQRIIEEWQNPPDCRARRFLLWKPNNFGLGSDIHTIGAPPSDQTESVGGGGAAPSESSVSSSTD